MSEPHADLPDDPTAPQPAGTCPFGPASPFAAYYCPPRLGIIHLLAWTAATAVLLKFSMAMRMSADTSGIEMPLPMEVVQKALHFIQQAVYAAGLVAAGILVAAKVRRHSGRLQPGHWLVLVETVALLLWMSCQDAYVLMLSAGRAAAWATGLYRAGRVVQGGMYVYAAWTLRDGLRWRICFGALAAASLMWELSNVATLLIGTHGLFISSLLRPLLVGAVLLAAMVVDLRRGLRRDWLHWVGVGIIATNMLLSVGWWVRSIFANRLI